MNITLKIVTALFTNELTHQSAPILVQNFEEKNESVARECKQSRNRKRQTRVNGTEKYGMVRLNSNKKVLVSKPSNSSLIKWKTDKE